jgi:mannobiose 2-epimerase
MPHIHSELVDPTVRKKEQELAQRMRRIAEQNVEYWLIHGPDREFGGFHGFLGRQGEPLVPTDKGLLQQSRHLWTFSTWYERREKSERIEGIARNLVRFILDHFGDERGDGFFRKVDRAGNVVDRVHQVYPEAFAVYALSTFGRVFGEPLAIERALRCFKAFDRRVHEPTFGGYDLTGDPPWQTPGASKETNTHIHVMEALTALGEVSHDALVHQRLREFTELTIARHRQPLNYAHLEFLLDYTPFGEPRVSYGHDLETSWLVLDAMRVVAAEKVVAPLPGHIAETALEMGKASARWGFDTEKGGYFNAGIPAGRVLDYEKLWWVQFEALPALVKLHRARVLPDALNRLEWTLNWLETGQLDQEFGGFYWGVMPDGTLGPYGDRKGDPWKASYHDLRGLMFASDWLDDSP